MGAPGRGGGRRRAYFPETVMATELSPALLVKNSEPLPGLPPCTGTVTLVRPAGTITSNRPAYSFRPVHQGLVNGTLLFCDREGGAAARAIIISPTGRPRVSRRDSDNRPLHCG